MMMDWQGFGRKRLWPYYACICLKGLNKTRVSKRNGKAIPVTGRGGPYGCETSRIPHFLDNRLTDGAEVVSLKHHAKKAYGGVEV
jgi:hypothetical protein